MGAGGPAQRKVAFFEKVIDLVNRYDAAFVVDADFVGGFLMARVRKALRPLNAELIMGKNTLMRKAIRTQTADKPELELLLPYIVKNMGFVFCNPENLTEVKQVLKDNRVGAAAKAGVISPVNVIVPAGNTGLDPSQTSFMQALSIQTKINRGQVEIINPVELIAEGDKVGASQAMLLQKLGIKPFSYGLELLAVFEDGSVYDASVLDLSDEDILKGFSAGVAQIAAVSLGASFPTAAAFPHVVLNAYKNVQAIALATEYTYEQIAELKALLNDPEALAAAQAASAPAAGSSSGGAAEAEAKKETTEEESDEEMGFGLFD